MPKTPIIPIPTPNLTHLCACPPTPTPKAQNISSRCSMPKKTAKPYSKTQQLEHVCNKILKLMELFQYEEFIM